MFTADSTRTNPNCARTFASLALYGADLDPLEVTRRLGVQPTDSALRGDKHVSKAGTRVAPMGRWILSSADVVRTDDAAVHVGHVLNAVDRHRTDLRALPGVDRARVSIYWASATGHGGPTFPPAVLARVVQLGLSLELDIYFLGESRPSTG